MAKPEAQYQGVTGVARMIGKAIRRETSGLAASAARSLTGRKHKVDTSVDEVQERHITRRD